MFSTAGKNRFSTAKLAPNRQTTPSTSQLVSWCPDSKLPIHRSSVKNAMTAPSEAPMTFKIDSSENHVQFKQTTKVQRLIS